MIKSPNYTQIPNEYFDVIMRQLNGSENLVFLAIMRKTFGWQKKKDRISYAQIMELTGIKSKETLSNAIKSLECLQLINIEKIGQQCTYSIKIEETSTNNEPVQNSNRYGNCTGTGTETVPVNQKTGTETVHTKESNINKLSKETYADIESAYTNAFYELFPKGKCVINYGAVRKRIRTILGFLTKEDVFTAITRAKQDTWIINHGFVLMTILSDNQIQKLLNGHANCSQPYSKPKYHVEQGVPRRIDPIEHKNIPLPEDLF